MLTSAHTVHVHPAANNWIQIIFQKICSICLMVKQMVDRRDFRQMLIGLEASFAHQAQFSHYHSCHMITAVTW